MLVIILCGLILIVSSPAVFAGNYTDVFTAINNEAGQQLSTALNVTDLQGFFQNASMNCTYFAPQDSAFQLLFTQLNLSQASFAANPGPITDLLLYHATLVSQTTMDFPNTTNISSVYATYMTSKQPALNLTVRYLSDGTYQINSVGSDANITSPDNLAGNSTVHGINRVLLPFFTNFGQSLTRMQHTRTLLAYANVYASNLLTSLTTTKLEYTMFIATADGFNSRFAAFQQFISHSGMNFFINAHIVPKPLIQMEGLTNMTVTTLAGVNLTLIKYGDDNVTVTSVGGVTARILFTYNVGFTANGTNLGLIYVVDRPLIPIPAPEPLYGVRADMTVFTRAIFEDGAYTSIFNGTGAFTGTFLVPTDAAFRTFLAYWNTTARLLTGSKDALKRLLAVHVLNGTILTARSMTNNTRLNSVAGTNTLTVTISGFDISIRTTNTSIARVVGNKEYYVGNVSATVLAIDTVLVPAGWTLPEDAKGTDPGAASVASPSLWVTLLSCLLALALLHGLGRQ